MDENIIMIPARAKGDHPSGFTTSQFRRLDGLYLQAAAEKTITYRTVDCDFDEGTASYTYYKVASQSPLFQFVIRQVGPRATMFEVYAEGRGRIAKSGLFERAYDKLREEIEALS